MNAALGRGNEEGFVVDGQIRYVRGIHMQKGSGTFHVHPGRKHGECTAALQQGAPLDAHRSTARRSCEAQARRSTGHAWLVRGKFTFVDGSESDWTIELRRRSLQQLYITSHGILKGYQYV